jgi:UDP-N-acetyl-2-amino-2-deoxyglucuronate dehydrogenase
MKNFALTGVAGFVAPRHLQAIHDTGNRLVAAVDPHDAVGILDRYSFDARFFTEIERFDRHLEKLRRGPDDQRVHYLSICSPNYLHDAHIRLALRVGAHAICEKPTVINPWNLDALEELEAETGKTVNTLLQLRLHPELVAVKARLAATPEAIHEVCLTYVTVRGPWYAVSWKGSEERSGGVVTNIGIHLFDVLLWLFGPIGRCEVHQRDARRAAGYLELARARVTWLLSTDPSDLPFPAAPGTRTTFRELMIDGHAVEFSDGLADLHTRVYERALAGQGFRIPDVRPSIELTHRIRHARMAAPTDARHPSVAGV